MIFWVLILLTIKLSTPILASLTIYHQILGKITHRLLTTQHIKKSAVGYFVIYYFR